MGKLESNKSYSIKFVNLNEDDIGLYLKHIGMPRRSGRYPWGSGERPYQSSDSFMRRVRKMRRDGFTEAEIAKYMKLTTTQLRTQIGLANVEQRMQKVEAVKALREKGLSYNKIAQQLGIPEPTVRSYLNEDSERRMNQAMKTAEFLKKQVDEKGFIDVGAGVEHSLGNISREKLNQALYILEMEGYNVYGGRMEQVTNPGKHTTMMVLTPPGTEHKEIFPAMKEGKVHSIEDWHTSDGGETFHTFKYPASFDSNRLAIRYGNQGGDVMDGLIQIRRGVEDVSIGESAYAQVRILVDGTHYIKGMAVYSDDLPPGVDMVFNTDKPSSMSKMEVLKPIEKNPDNPFGSYIKANGQSYYIDKNGKEQLRVINKRADEGDWAEWQDRLPSQFLAKQNKSLIQSQINLSLVDKQSEYAAIMALTNPTVKKQLLQSFADDCDSAAVHLYAAALPRQKYQVILPINSLKDKEVYAPRFNDGETVALVRFPHGGTFEIPILTVNNKNKDGKKMIGNMPQDAIGININNAKRLSGADFDGDAVLVIPINDRIKVTNQPYFEGLKNFDPKMKYGGKPEGTYKRLKNTDQEMGKISNLITDMTILGASPLELERAVKHSMVVIDAAKHGLDYKQSEKDHRIKELKKEYQSGGGVSTLLSRAKSPEWVAKRQGSPIVNIKGHKDYDPSIPEGALIWKISDKATYLDKKGVTQTRKQKSTKMMETHDAYSLVSEARNPIEMLYADYANSLKSMANSARKEKVTTGNLKYNPSAKKTYAKEVEYLNSQLKLAEKNRPRERQAQSLANSIVEAMLRANPDITEKEKGKIQQQALATARARTGAKRTTINITSKSWEAIQAGAISENKLKKILDHTDTSKIREYATPRQIKELSSSQKNKINAMRASGYTLGEIAESIGRSPSTISNYLSGGN